MNILHIARAPDTKFSGVAVVVPNYIKYQSLHSAVALLNLHDDAGSGINKAYKTFTYIKSKGLDSADTPFNRPDLVVFHEIYCPEFIAIAKTLKRLNIPYIITPHVSLTQTAQHHKRIKKILGNLLMFNGFIKGASAIHYLSQSERMQSIRYKDIPSFISPNGIELRGKLKHNFSTKGLKLIYVGRLEIQIKGIDRIIESVNIVQDEMRSRNIAVTLHGYDEANNTKWIQDRIEMHGISDIVKLRGALFGDEKINTILEHDYFIQLSRTEGQPLGIMEALDIGMPCIVTEGTTFHSVIKDHTAGISTGNSLEEISASIINASNLKTNLNNYSENASSYAYSTFNWRTVSADHIENYSKVISAHTEKGV